MTIHRFSASDFTLVHNQFIDQYMTDANGEFVKIYLYLLRCSALDAEISLCSIADALHYTESDVRRALAYWERIHLLRLTYDAHGVLTDLAFTDGTEGDGVSASPHAAAQPFAASQTTPDAGLVHTETEPAAPKAESAATAEAVVVPAKMTVSADRKKELAAQDEVKELIYIVEQYMKKPLSSTELNHILYFYDELHFSSDLIEYLIEYCLSKGKRSISYIRKVALEWHTQGVSTVEEAKRDTSLYHKDYYTVLNAFGIRGRGPAQAEMEYMRRWFQEFGFSADIVLEACRRTINRTHTPSFPYADSILGEWKDKGVHYLKDIELLDKPAPSAKPAASSQTKPRTKSEAPHHFAQRDYDFDQLEQQFLTNQRRTRRATE